MTWQAAWLKKFTNLDDTKNILEIGAGNYQTSKSLAQGHPDKNFFGIDFVFSNQALETFESLPTNFSIIKHDARELSIIQNEYFDFVFSVAVLEHIHELKQHLDEIYKLLKKGGRYVFYESPLWSSSLGHHYLHWTKDCPIPNYGHLYMNRNEIENHLKNIKIKTPTINHILDRIYVRDDLSRLSYTQTKEIIENTKFKITKWELVEDTNFDTNSLNNIKDNNIYDINIEDLKIKGIMVILTK